MSQLKLIIVSGIPGTGKSTLSESLSKNLSIPVFSVDPIESAIIKSGIKKSFETGYAAYLVAETLASEHLKLGSSVIIDAVSPVIESRKMWNDLASKYNAKQVIIECVLDSKIHKKRIESRTRNIPGIPEVTWEDVENRRKEYLAWQEDRLALDTNQEKEALLKKALDYIKNPS